MPSPDLVDALFAITSSAPGQQYRDQHFRLALSTPGGSSSIDNEIQEELTRAETYTWKGGCLSSMISREISLIRKSDYAIRGGDE